MTTLPGSGSRRSGWRCVAFAAICTAKSRVIFFDIIGFKQYLFEQTEMSHGTVREYVVRLRRLGNYLSEQNISHDLLQDGFLDESLAPWLPETSTNNYRIALRKYQQYKAYKQIAPKQTSPLYRQF